MEDAKRYENLLCTHAVIVALCYFQNTVYLGSCLHYHNEKSLNFDVYRRFRSCGFINRTITAVR